MFRFLKSFQIFEKFSDIWKVFRFFESCQIFWKLLWPETWHLRHRLHFWQLRSTIAVWPLNTEWWWQHSQFVRCLIYSLKKSDREGQWITSGVAYRGTACETRMGEKINISVKNWFRRKYFTGSQININWVQDDDWRTVVTFAHELGHNMGMRQRRWKWKSAISKITSFQAWLWPWSSLRWQRNHELRRSPKGLVALLQ